MCRQGLGSNSGNIVQDIAPKGHKHITLFRVSESKVKNGVVQLPNACIKVSLACNLEKFYLG